MKKIISIFICCLALQANAQKRSCGTMDVLAKQLKDNPSLKANMDAIEKQTADFVANYNPNKSTRGVITIPVVVHVLHNGEAIGQGANISVAQIQSQIQALNEDYRKKNDDTLALSHPYQSVTADPEIMFCLATLDENNQPTSGITRDNIGVSSVSESDMDNIVKPQTIWNRDKYLNFWTCNLTGGILGYAQFPGGTANTDGVVILNTAFGYVGNISAQYNQGRTAVHETGHWLNLYHIWGDDTGDPDECAGSDFVADTKNQATENYGTPIYPHITCNNGPYGDMFMNYMDYVDDVVMVMFTQGQKARMQAALNGPRASLKLSTGCGLNVAIQNVEKNPLASINIFPNPVNDNFEINVPITDGNYAFTITNTAGQIVKQNSVNAINGLVKEDVSNLASGIYFVKIVSGTNEVVKKFVKK